MKIERYECDKCHRVSNGDLGDWFSVRQGTSSNIVELFRLVPQSIGSDVKHACGEACAFSLVAELIRTFPK